MSNIIDLKKGLNIPISGVAALEAKKTIMPDTVAIKPTDFKGLSPRLLVKEGDKVLAGSPVLADKQHQDILLTSPVSGTVAEIVRGEKRKLLAVLVKADGSNEAVDFGAKNPSGMKAEASLFTQTCTLASFETAVTPAWIAATSSLKANSASAARGAVENADTKIALGVKAGSAMIP